MMFEQEMQDLTAEEISAEELYENTILYALKSYIRKNGKPSEALLETLTCIPFFMKATMLELDDENALRYYDDFDLNSMNLPYEIIEAFAAENNFMKKEEWRIKFADELKTIDEAKLFPAGIYECFAEAYLAVRDTISLEELKKIRKVALENKDRRLGNLIFRDLTEHLLAVTIDPTIVEAFTCVPKFMKMTLLGEGDLGKSFYESRDHSVSYENLRYEIMEEFIRNHDFPLKEMWDDALSDEIYKIEKSGYFPSNIFICFQEALLDFWTSISFQNVWEIKRILNEEEGGDKKS